MRTITSEWIDKWMERFSSWQKRLQEDSVKYATGKVTINREDDGLIEIVKVEVDVTTKARFDLVPIPSFDIQKTIEFSTLDGQEKFDEVEFFIYLAESAYCMPRLNGARFISQRDMERKYAPNAQKALSRHLAGKRGYMSSYEQDACIGYDSAQ